jgi:hypothetical protein
MVNLTEQQLKAILESFKASTEMQKKILTRLNKINLSSKDKEDIGIQVETITNELGYIQNLLSGI